MLEQGDVDAVTEDEVQTKLRKLALKKAPGVDGIRNGPLKLLPKTAVRRITRLINAMLSFSIFPQTCGCGHHPQTGERSHHTGESQTHCRTSGSSQGLR